MAKGKILYLNDAARIKKICKIEGITLKKLSEEIGNSEKGAGVYNITSGKYHITERFAKDINRRYPKYSIQWLIDGTGPMLDTNPEISAQIPQKKVADGEDNTIGDLQDRLRDKEYIIQLQKQRIEQLEQQLEKEKVRSESHSTSPALSPNQ